MIWFNGFKVKSWFQPFVLFSEEYGQYYGQMNTMQAGRMMTVKRDGLPYEEMGYSAMPPPNRLVALLV